MRTKKRWKIWALAALMVAGLGTSTDAMAAQQVMCVRHPHNPHRSKKIRRPKGLRTFFDYR